MKEVLNVLVNDVLAPYVEDIDLNEVRSGIEKGHFTLHNLRLKRGPLEKFLLPVEFIKGHLGTFSLSLNWQNFGNEAIRVVVEDVYLLVVPPSDAGFNAAEEQRKAQATKLERLRLAELLLLLFEAELERLDFIADAPQRQGLFHALIANLIDNLEVSVKNVHVRYEDNVSVPNHLFSVGATLAGFTATPANGQWLSEQTDDLAGEVHKLVRLECFALYLDSDTTSLVNLSHDDFVGKFAELISHEDTFSGHQFILKPVCGQCRIRISKISTYHTPQFDIQLHFDSIGFSLDSDQYQDIVALVDFYIRRVRLQNHRHRHGIKDLSEGTRATALWKLALSAILDQIRDRQRRSTWAWLAERRNARRRYIDLFNRNQRGVLDSTDATALEALEEQLSYRDLRLYRFIARSQSKAGPTYESGLVPTYTFDALRKGALKARVVAEIQYASFALNTHSLGTSTEIIVAVLDKLEVTFKQWSDNCETTVSLASVAVRDCSDPNTPYPLVVYLKDEGQQGNSKFSTVEKPLQVETNVESGFSLKVDTNLRDPRAGSVVTVHTRDVEIVYHRGYIEALRNFFKLSDLQLESVTALNDWLMRVSPLFRWFSIAGQTTRALFSLRLRDEREIPWTEDLTFLLQFSASVKARIVPPPRIIPC
ncbi:N-terminal region of Chorein, a TM vesicle-mediated sorter-domain-containing protein [Cytidiella melzeri]|nr:N-terminal region of Chorein, a TM vesicle-mediated sorter-domain-containing protein [Cytidiella melzeri]